MPTNVCETLGIDLPIILAPMGGAVGPELAAAVSNAGGMGAIPLWSGPIANLRAAVRHVKVLTTRPFAVNLNLEFDMNERLDACLEEQVPVISFFWGDPGDLVRRAKDAGAIVMQSVGTADEAKRAVDLGADIIVAQGWEAGGHVWGMVATLPLVPSIVDAVPGTPVVAAGGIADGRGLAAVLSLGAGAAWIGTRFLSSAEATIHPAYRQRLYDSCEADTIHLMDLFDGNWPAAPYRALRNSVVDAWEAAGSPAPGHRPGEGEVIARSASKGDVMRYQSFTPPPDTTGDVEACSMWSGQGVSMVRRTEPAADIVADIMDQARSVMGSVRL